MTTRTESRENHTRIAENELDLIERRANAATPGPWYVRYIDDDNAMNLVAISTALDTGNYERYPDFDEGEIVAATLVPLYVDVNDQRWGENADFIAAARTDVPRLVAEVRACWEIMERLENIVKAADHLCFDKEIAGDITFKSEPARRAFVELCQAVVAVYRDGATNWNEVVQILQR